MPPDEKTPQAVHRLRDAVARDASLGISVRRVLTHIGSASRFGDCARTGAARGPRPPAGIAGGAGGAAVLAGLAKVVDPAANGLSAECIAGARHALEQARAKGIRLAVLEEGSPACASDHLHDGTFSGTRVHGLGVTAVLLASAGVRVFSELPFEAAAEWLQSLEMQEADLSSHRRARRSDAAR